MHYTLVFATTSFITWNLYVSSHPIMFSTLEVRNLGFENNGFRAFNFRQSLTVNKTVVKTTEKSWEGDGTWTIRLEIEFSKASY